MKNIFTLLKKLLSVKRTDDHYSTKPVSTDSFKPVQINDVVPTTASFLFAETCPEPINDKQQSTVNKQKLKVNDELAAVNDELAIGNNQQWTDNRKNVNDDLAFCNTINNYSNKPGKNDAKQKGLSFLFSKNISSHSIK